MEFGIFKESLMEKIKFKELLKEDSDRTSGMQSFQRNHYIRPVRIENIPIEKCLVGAKIVPYKISFIGETIVFVCGTF